MRRQEAAAETQAQSDTAWMRVALHDLSQPLTALECVLYLGSLTDRDSPDAAAEALTAITAGLAQCERMMVQVRAMHARLTELDQLQS